MNAFLNLITENKKPLDSFQLKVATQWLNNENITFNLVEENTTFKIPATIETIIWDDIDGTIKPDIFSFDSFQSFKYLQDKHNNASDSINDLDQSDKTKSESFLIQKLNDWSSQSCLADELFEDIFIHMKNGAKSISIFNSRLANCDWLPSDDFIRLLTNIEILRLGNNADLNHINVSKVTNLDIVFTSGLGARSDDTFEFNGNISKWDVSNVKSMRAVFQDSKFNGDISNWDVSNVESMRSLFQISDFNGDISKWDVSNVTDMGDMFISSPSFNSDISNWDTSNVTNMRSMFCFSKFNGDISKWDVSNVDNIAGMFRGSNFNGNISMWDISNVSEENLQEAFLDSSIPEENKPKFITKPIPEVETSKPMSEPVKIKTTGLFPWIGALIKKLKSF
jgi:surface protein